MEYIFQPLENTIPSPTTPWDYALKGLIEGFLGGVEIVLPYAIPLMLILALLEDSGYLPRLAYVADSFFRFLGLSGRAVIPFITGYGCTVPAIMGLRSIPDERERRLAALLVPLVPCSARTVVLLALLVPLIGPVWGFGFYLFNLLVVAVVGKALERILRLRTPGLIMAIPPYRVPSAKVILWKIFLRMKDFFTWAWPILIVGSVALELGGYYNVNSVISSVFKWFTDLLHLPKETTIPLLFGLLKKELAVPMFYNAIEPIKDSVTFGQKLRFSMFTLFYIPCISTIAVIWKEFGGRWALLSSLINLVTATAVAMLFLWIR